MADIYTHLRELGVGFSFYNDKHDLEDITPTYFLEVCRGNIIGCEPLQINQIAKNKLSFGKNELSIIKNANNLGKKIKEYFSIPNKPKIIWTGLQTQSNSTIDLIIENIPFSLKEESFILENMGLYRLLNILTDSEKYQKGVHIFEEFAEQELNQWFEVTRDLLIEKGPKNFKLNKALGYTVTGKIENNILIMTYKDKKKDCSVSIEDFKNLTYEDYKNRTNSTVREKVFSKWIKEKVEKENAYILSKKNCAVKAGERLIAFLGNIENTSPTSLKRFFRIEPMEYYYSKTTGHGVEIYKVPSEETASKEIVINKVCFDVPKSQLNFCTEIKNKKTNKVITFRNELRYSHGQFNGTPEAKSYIKNGELSTMYEKIV